MGNQPRRKRRFGQIRQYRSGRWGAHYLGPDLQRHRCPHPLATRLEAVGWLCGIEQHLSRGDWRSPKGGKVSFRIYASSWVEERVLAATTVDLYLQLLKKHLLPYLGDWDLDEITPPRVRTWRAQRLKATGPTVIAKSYRLLKAILETAVDDELIRRNPCRIPGAGKEHAPERPIATISQVDALADAVGPRWRLMVYLAAYGPARPEELAALRRRDVDTEFAAVRVARAAPELHTGQRALGVTKSPAGVRILILPGFLRLEIKAHLELFADPGPDGLLFIDEHGTPVSRSILGRRWRKARTTVRLPEDFHFYDLRHTGHTLATQNGATLRDTMVRAGQVSERAALIYQHSNRQRQQDIADALDHAVRAHRQRPTQRTAGPARP
ncbi:tyrosine-type recombinase/integrase [Streptacidiphilus sp. PAMC 29251]